PADLLVGDRMIGTSLHYLGDHTDARRHIERMLAGYIAPVQRPHTVRFQLDQRVTARARLTSILWLQGFPDQAMRTAQSNVEDALAIDHALSLCIALADGACPIALLIGDLDAAERFVAMLIDHSGKHAFNTWLALGHICEAVLLIQRDEVVTGLPLLRAALDELRETGYFHRYLGSLGTFAEALGPAGQVERASLRSRRPWRDPSAPKHAGAWPSCCASKAALFCTRADRIPRKRPRVTFSKASTGRGVRARSSGNGLPPGASHGCGTTRAERKKPIGSSRRSMIG